METHVCAVQNLIHAVCFCKVAWNGTYRELYIWCKTTNFAPGSIIYLLHVAFIYIHIRKTWHDENMMKNSGTHAGVMSSAFGWWKLSKGEGGIVLFLLFIHLFLPLLWLFINLNFLETSAVYSRQIVNICFSEEAFVNSEMVQLIFAHRPITFSDGATQ